VICRFLLVFGRVSKFNTFDALPLAGLFKGYVLQNLDAKQGRRKGAGSGDGNV
jgi:hypothetical protein